MPESNQLRSTAWALGMVALILISVGTGLALVGDGLSDPTVGLLLRVGAILGGLALVLPTLRRPSLSTIVVIAAATGLVLFRPALVWVGLVVYLGWAWSRQRKMASRDS